MTESPRETLVRKLKDQQDAEMSKLASVCVGRLRGEITRLASTGANQQKVERLGTRQNALHSVLGTLSVNTGHHFVRGWTFEEVLEEATVLIGETVSLRMAGLPEEERRAELEGMVRDIQSRRAEVRNMAPISVLDLDTFLKIKGLTLDQALEQMGVQPRQNS
jgi:hypothetical protein